VDKSFDIETIKARKQEFACYLKNNLDDTVYNTINSIRQATNVYIFSGIIRDFFLNKTIIRDIDIVIESEINVDTYFKDYIIKKNSFGGFKIKVNNTNIDLWRLKDTWALKREPDLGFELAKVLPKTAFFNFSAISYSLNEGEFYVSYKFVDFLKTNTIDIVLEDNPNYPLCIINSIYYSEAYNLRLSKKLKLFIKEHSAKYPDFETVQQKHFGNILYTNQQVKEFVKERINTNS
jgi:hypothetical protein